jgi:plasmid stability protein
MPEDHKTIIRLPKDLHTEARIKALREGKSLSAVIRELLVQWLKEPLELEEPKKKTRSK